MLYRMEIDLKPMQNRNTLKLWVNFRIQMSLCGAQHVKAPTFMYCSIYIFHFNRIRALAYLSRLGCRHLINTRYV